MDNTEIFRVMVEALGLGAADDVNLKRTEVAPRQP
jgi:hypothetical protein